ncbi:MAG: energy-coupled thiamine transporter ThiT [Firmicutes bacterium]|nr:energy-coupled thiamine transporter ThiT [Bacillota bacterium]
MKKKNQIQIIAEIGVLTSIALVLDLLANLWGPLLGFVNGGSVSIAMLPIFVIAFRRGILPGLEAGLILGVLQIALGKFYYLNFFQFMLDYILAFTLVGFAGLFRKGSFKPSHLVYGMLLGSFLRLVSAYFAGALYWSAYILEGIQGVDSTLHSNFASWLLTPESITWVGSFIYNAAYLIPSALLCILFGLILQKRGILTVNH